MTGSEVATAAAPDGTADRARPRRWRAALAWSPLLALVLAPVAVPVAAVSGASMEPTLHDGDRVAIARWGGSSGRWHRGDLVVLEDPSGAPGAPLLVKRVVALGGDVVAIRDGVLLVNHHAVVEAYADPDLIDSVYFGPVRVRADHAFVLGDNRRDSTDSRAFGAVPEDGLRGRVVATVWPPAHWGASPGEPS